MIVYENGGINRKVCNGRVFRESDIPKDYVGERFIFRRHPTDNGMVVACRKGKPIRM